MKNDKNTEERKNKYEFRTAKDIWNIDVLKESLLDDRETIVLVLETFLNDFQIQIKKLDEYLKRADIEKISRQAHTMKGAAANVGAELLRKIAYETEQAGKLSDINKVKNLSLKINYFFTETEKLMREYINSK